MIDDVGQFLGMELRIYRHRRKPGLPAGIEQLRIGWAVGHDKGDAIAGMQRQWRPAQRAGDARDARV